ncbi:MAG: hypothetical protein ACREK9_21105 [Candidatus Rokuibacteriota bacterium]
MRPFIPTSLAVVLALALASPAFAQDPPSWKQGQPAGMAGPLAPIAQPPAPKEPGAIPVDKRLAGQDFDYLVRLLRGFRARTASGLDGTMTDARRP